jgi:phasin family protein
MNSGFAFGRLQRLASDPPLGAKTMAKKFTTDANETVENAMKNGAEAIKNSFEQATKSYDRFVGFGKENVEAAVKAATTYTKAVEQMNTEAFDFSKRQIEDGVAAWKAVLGAKTVQEAITLQSDYTKTAMDAYISHFTKFNDMFMSTAKTAAEPVNARIHAFTEMVKDARGTFGQGFPMAAE